ncbi:MAG TPA: 7-carboxy-7-deazaguanine synthase [Pseudomonadota bacterium]|nr:7-carboxy-7-deazaguanine synthase [Pseudomonadota bacterium]
MSYFVKELFYTLQGEGFHTGRAAVFCRFSGCNLWSGHEADRAKAVCRFCDTDFVGHNGPSGGKFATPDVLADAILSVFAKHTSHTSGRFVVLTGGEPLLQVDAPLVRCLHARGFRVAVETNGTRPLPTGTPLDCLDWVCVSPKAGADLVVTKGDELKLVFPQEGVLPAEYEGLAFAHFFLSPMDGPNREKNTALAIAYCLKNPTWRLTLQTHKYLGIP